MWLALPITSLKYWRAWDELPLRMAVHFDANWQPNGYTSREGSLELGLGIMVFMLIVFTVAGLIVRALNRAASWPMLIVFYVVLGFVWFGNSSIVEWNLGHAQESRHALVRKEFPPCLGIQARVIETSLSYKWLVNRGHS